MFRVIVLISAALLSVCAAENSKRVTELTSTLFPLWDEFYSSHSFSWPDAAKNTIKSVTEARKERVRASLNCSPLPNCTVDAWKITDQDERSLADALRASNAPESLQQAWPWYVKDINRIFDVYGNGAAPLYQQDGMTYQVNGTEWTRYINETAGWLVYGPSEPAPLDAIHNAVTLLDANDRSDALRWSKVWNGVNMPARKYAKSVKWSKYKYSAIIVLGEAPERYDEPMSPSAKRRCGIAVDFFRQNLAPFLIPTGAADLPKHTKYVEGLQMGNWLVEEYDIPTDRVIRETQARHTTTNLRNAARIMKALNAPSDMPMLIVSEMYHIQYVLDVLDPRALREQGYILGKYGPRVGHYGLEYRPADEVVIVDPHDPLDP